MADLTWPPEPGQYDKRGLSKQAGELTSMFLALTHEEIRAFVQGLAQSRPPSREANGQIFQAANALVAQLSTQRLTWQQCKDAWARLFGNEVGSLCHALVLARRGVAVTWMLAFLMLACNLISPELLRSHSNSEEDPREPSSI